MDDTAIKQIQQKVTLRELSEHLNETETKTPTLAIPDGFSILDLEEYMPQRSSYRINFNTISRNAFVDYCNLEQNDKTKCFINTVDMSAMTYFDLGTQLNPLHRRHTALLQPKKTAAYIALLSFADARTTSQKTASEFLEDWGFCLSVTDETGNKLKTAAAARALRNITVDRMKSNRTEVGNFSHEVDVMEKAEARSTNEQMPAFIKFKTAPYLDFNEREFIVQLSVNIDERIDKVGLKFRIVRHEMMIEDIGEEFLGSLNALFESEITTFVGSI